MDLLCDRYKGLQILLGIALTFFVITFPMLFIYEWGSANSVVTVMNVFGSTAFAVGTYLVMRKCNRRE